MTCAACTKFTLLIIFPFKILCHRAVIDYYTRTSNGDIIMVIRGEDNGISSLKNLEAWRGGMQLLTCGISFRHLFVFHLQVLSHLSLIHIMDQSVTCLMVHFILVLKLIFSSSSFLHRSVSSFTHWSARTFNCPLRGRIWRFKCRQVRHIKPAQLAFGRTIK